MNFNAKFRTLMRFVSCKESHAQNGQIDSSSRILTVFFKKDFEKMDKNGNGLLELQDMVEAMIEVRSFEYDQLHNFKLIDRNSDGFLDLTEIRHFPLRIIGIPMRDLEHLLKDRYPYLERPVESVDPSKVIY